MPPAGGWAEVSAFAHSELRAGQLRKLTEISRALTYTVSLDEVLRLTVERAAELLHSDKAVLMLSNDEGLLTVRSSWGIDAARCDTFREPLLETMGDRLRGLLIEDGGTGHFTAVPLVVSGEVMGLLAVAHSADPSDEEQEWLLSALADQAAMALEKTRLDETGAFRERLMGIVGHDLRTPLQAITMAATLLLRDDALDERPRVLARRVANSAARMADIIDQLLDFTRSRLGGGIAITREDIELNDVCRRVIDELELVYPGRPIVLAAGPLSRGEWDPDRLAQALSNIVGNALRHGSQTHPITVSTSTAEGSVVVDIHNEGEPIPVAAMPHLFDPFRRGTSDADAASPGAGLGLGLFIAQQIIHAHDGGIAVSSSAADGTTVSIRLPHQASAAPSLTVDPAGDHVPRATVSLVS
jgi:sigma-B regulation protein RsbU (phosphoserine phosphatase)